MRFLAGLFAFLALSFSSVAVAQCEDECDAENAVILEWNPYDPGQLEYWVWLRERYYIERQDAAYDIYDLEYYFFDPMESWLWTYFGTTDLHVAYNQCVTQYGSVYLCSANYPDFDYYLVMYEWYQPLYEYLQCMYYYWDDLYWDAWTVVINWP